MLIILLLIGRFKLFLRLTLLFTSHSSSVMKARTKGFGSIQLVFGYFLLLEAQR